MDDLKKNKMFWVVAIFTVLNLVLLIGSKVVISKTADKVIERLQKEYSPSPYGPGIDPDKVDSDSLKNQKMYFELRQKDDGVSASQNTSTNQNVSWRDVWESDRGFSPEQ